MDLKQLRYFKAVIDEGGVRKASEQLRITQPTISVALQNLEKEMGVKLFARQGRKLHPTIEGLHFHKRARAILVQADRLKAEINSFKSLERAEVKIAAPAMVANYVLTDPISDFIQSYPGVHIRLVQLSGPEVESALLSGEIDIGFIGRDPRSIDIAAHDLCVRKICAFVSCHHELAYERTLSWPQIFKFPLVIPPRKYLLYDSIQRFAMHFRLPVSIALESDAPVGLVPVIERGESIGILIEDFERQHSSLKRIDIEGASSDSIFDLRIKVKACTAMDVPLSHAAHAFLKYLMGILDAK